MKAVIAISGAKSKKTMAVKLGISKIANYTSSWMNRPFLIRDLYLLLSIREY